MKRFSLTREQVRELCPSCAEHMGAANLKLLKLEVADDGSISAASPATLKVFAGFSQGLCDKFGGDDGFFTRCADTMSGKVDDENAFCASLHHYCIGKWPAEKHSYSYEHDNKIRGVEIFATGTHNGDEYTEKDLDDMVEAHRALDFHPALKVGHTKDKPGDPSYGWVSNLRRVGQKLVADFEGMHDSVIEAIRKRSYDNVSAEVYFNLKRAGKTFRRALKAVALLGAEVPAVANLVPLHKVEFAEGEFEKALFTEDSKLSVSAEAVFECLSERLVKIIREGDVDMKTKAEQLKELSAKIADATKQIAELGAGSDKDKEAKIKTLSESIAKLSDEVKALSAAEDGDLKKLQEEREQDAAKLKKAEEEIAQMRAESRARKASEKTATVKVPAFRPAFSALYTYAVEHEAEKVKVYSKDKDGKEVATEKTFIEVIDGLAGDINAQAERLFKALAQSGTPVRTEGTEPAADAEVGNEVDRLTKQYMREKSVKEYSVAMQAVLEGDPQLAQRYADQTRTRAVSGSH